MSTVVDDHEQLQPETPTTHYEDVVKIPGMGEPPDRCRGMKPVGFCDHGHVVLGRSSCETRYCPDHWRDWVEEDVINIVARLAAYREVVEGAEKRLSHVVASYPADRRYSVREMWETRSDAYDALEDAGVRGGSAIVHPYRTNERGDMLYETAKDAGDVDEDTGRWRFLRDLSEGWNELSQYVEASPHVHSLAVAPDIDGEAAPGDWVVSRIRSMKPFFYRDTEAYRDMARAAYYVLTHGAVQDGRSTLTWFGDVHPSGFNPEEELTAAKWDRIQIEAEKAVKEYGDDSEQGAGHGPEQCPVDGCEGVVKDLMYLDDWLDDDDNISDLLAQRDGRERWLRLRGTKLWMRGMTDRPPPSVMKDERRLRNWLEMQGETGVREPHQVSITAAAQ